MLVIGIDPGIARTGYGVVKQGPDGSLTAVEYGVIKTSSELPQATRLLEISDQLSQLLSLHRPESAAVEKLFLREHVNSALSVGQASGVAMLILAEAKLEVREYAPLVVKQAICGYGGADKPQMQEMVKTLLGLEERPRPDDAADALAVAICHIHIESTRQRLSEA
ncbi:MAG: crossover junction endodeoxyribonuclease RuvC [Chloroflexi bacterium]|nr:crossover junction endodeoxyribonuclease RuvC [Chloroflexota bacterium]